MAEEQVAMRQLETRVTRLEEGQATLLAATARIESMVENLGSGQKGVYDRINRPWQWGAVVAGFVAIMSLAGVFGTVLNLSISPIARAITDIQNHDDHIEDRINVLETGMVQVQRDALWLEKNTDLNHKHIDGLWDRVNVLHTPGFLHDLENCVAPN